MIRNPISEKEKWLLALPCDEDTAEKLFDVSSAQSEKAPITSNPSDLEYFAVRRAEYHAVCEKYWRHKTEIAHAVSKIDNEDCRAILVLRYLHRLSWDEVCDKTNFSHRQLHRLRKQALKALKIECMVWQEKESA